MTAEEALREFARKQMENRLSSEYERLLSILDGSPVSSFVIDSERRVTAWNMVNESFTGIAKEDALGKPLDLSPLFKDKTPPSLAALVLEMSDEEIMRRYATEPHLGDGYKAAVSSLSHRLSRR
jgi:PAS domain S-box-containing protein